MSRYDLMAVDFGDGASITARLPVWLDRIRYSALVWALHDEWPPDQTDDEHRALMSSVFFRACARIDDLAVRLAVQEELAERFVIAS